MTEKASQFEAIYRANYHKVVRICEGYVNGDGPLANDLTQEVFIKVWEHLHTFRNESNISTWVYRITVNTCLLELRKKKYTKASAHLERIAEAEEDLTSTKENQLQRMHNCINKLPKESRSIILLELEGLPQIEIAKIIGVSHEAIRVRVHRIKQGLTKCVQHENIR
ncbi:RNA polymerase sigma factor [Maribacter halichondriae]|uniref:RNA polymerase sigma factor n=1 Tax=Maribacter halichondriae TaxID=2980554 RepID=UPI00235A1D1A|nr:RNA polymerase sigma factor [Maribacter sp. Hal144]